MLFKKGHKINKGKKNAWKGDNLQYGGLHRRIKSELKKPDFCQDCGKNKKLDLANISQNYLLDLKDWEWLCRMCHMIKDGRIDSLKKLAESMKGKSKPIKKL